MKRWFRLTLNTALLRLRAVIDQWRIRYEQRTCPHIWRAIRLNNAPARLCKICDLAQPLSREDFYAQFGERYAAMLYAEAHSTVISKDASMAHVESDTVQ